MSGISSRLVYMAFTVIAVAASYSIEPQLTSYFSGLLHSNGFEAYLAAASVIIIPTYAVSAIVIRQIKRGRQDT